MYNSWSRNTFAAYVDNNSMLSRKETLPGCEFSLLICELRTDSFSLSLLPTKTLTKMCK